jgi:hypothetical protein
LEFFRWSHGQWRISISKLDGSKIFAKKINCQAFDFLLKYKFVNRFLQNAHLLNSTIFFDIQSFDREFSN